MTIPQLDRLRTHCHRLRLYQLESELPSLLEQAAKREQSYADFLDDLDERLKLLGQPQLLVIDEIGYIPIDRQGANLFFQLVSRRYERGAIILTSNQSLGAWGEVFGDPVIATAILDRLLHHSITVNIKGDSYRLREKLKAGLLKSRGADPVESAPSR